MGTLVVNEDRKIVDKFKSWYKEKVVDTGKAEKIEEFIEYRADLYKKKNDVAEKILPIVVKFIPEVSFLAPMIPAISNVGKKYYDLEARAVIGAKRHLEAKFIGVDGSNKDVVLPDLNVEEFSKDIVDTAKGISDAVTDYNLGETDIERVGRSR